MSAALEAARSYVAQRLEPAPAAVQIGENGGIEMFELAATPQRTFKGLTLLVDRDGMEIDVRLIVLGVDLRPCMSNRNDIDQCCNGAAVASSAQLPDAKLHRVLTQGG